MINIGRRCDTGDYIEGDVTLVITLQGDVTLVITLDGDVTLVITLKEM